MAAKVKVAGRPRFGPDGSKFLPDIKEKILEAARLGLSIKGCAARGGIVKSTLNDWLNRGEVELEPEYAEFAQDFRFARSQFEEFMLKKVIDAAEDPKNWQAATWVLTHAFRSEYANVDPSVGVHITHEITPNDALAAVIESIAEKKAKQLPAGDFIDVDVEVDNT